jgi:hypothetical protein
MNGIILDTMGAKTGGAQEGRMTNATNQARKVKGEGTNQAVVLQTDGCDWNAGGNQSRIYVDDDVAGTGTSSFTSLYCDTGAKEVMKRAARNGPRDCI